MWGSDCENRPSIRHNLNSVYHVPKPHGGTQDIDSSFLRIQLAPEEGKRVVVITDLFPGVIADQINQPSLSNEIREGESLDLSLSGFSWITAVIDNEHLVEVRHDFEVRSSIGRPGNGIELRCGEPLGRLREPTPAFFCADEAVVDGVAGDRQCIRHEIRQEQSAFRSDLEFPFLSDVRLESQVRISVQEFDDRLIIPFSCHGTDPVIFDVTERPNGLPHRVLIIHDLNVSITQMGKVAIIRAIFPSS